MITVRLHFTVKRAVRVIGLTVHLLGLCLLIGWKLSHHTLGETRLDISLCFPTLCESEARQLITLIVFDWLFCLEAAMWQRHTSFSSSSHIRLSNPKRPIPQHVMWETLGWIGSKLSNWWHPNVRNVHKNKLLSSVFRLLYLEIFLTFLTELNFK